MGWAALANEQRAELGEQWLVVRPSKQLQSAVLLKVRAGQGRLGERAVGARPLLDMLQVAAQGESVCASALPRPGLPCP